VFSTVGTSPSVNRSYPRDNLSLANKSRISNKANKNHFGITQGGFSVF